VERVIDALMLRASARDYLKSLDSFYLAIESAAGHLRLQRKAAFPE